MLSPTRFQEKNDSMSIRSVLQGNADSFKETKVDLWT